jgi:hypothetical protein
MNHKIWTAEKIKEGFDRFLAETGRLPTAIEVDSLEYLPNRKFIERNFGGIEKLRGQLGYVDTHLGKGKFRSKIALKVGAKGRVEELKIEKLLRDKFGEVFVHTEKIFDDTKNRVDFYVYSPSGNFGVDVFYTETIQNLSGNINIKLNKYGSFKDKLYFVVAGDSISQKDVDKYVLDKTKKLPPNSQIITVKNFESLIRNMQVYLNPLDK